MNNEPFTLTLEPDDCCGGGHCGILPGYFYVCPHCGKDTGCRTGDYLNVDESLTCFLCQKKIKALEKVSDFEYKFVLEDG